MTPTDVRLCQELLMEVFEVNESAIDAITAAMMDGAEHGYRGNWRGQSHVVHVAHAFGHLEQAMALGLSGHEALNHIAHALTRLSMAGVQWPSNSENQ